MYACQPNFVKIGSGNHLVNNEFSHFNHLLVKYRYNKLELDQR